jgi:hypothetical protein
MSRTKKPPRPPKSPPPREWEREQLDDDDEMKLLTMHVARLMEHFENVQIMVSRYEPSTKKTVQYCTGDGNYSARFGLALEWVTQEQNNFGLELDD